MSKTDSELAAEIADILRRAVDELTRLEKRLSKEGVCTCDERDGSYVCQYCFDQGFRGHMQRGV